MKRMIAIGVLCVLSAVLAISANVPVSDPGPRGEPVGAGGFFANLSPPILAGADDGAARFQETETFPGGLGPLYNSGPTGACSECHAQPAMGGSSPSMAAHPYLSQNPQATKDYDAGGANNTLPPFITPGGAGA